MKDKLPIISLIVLSIVVGLLWRLELEYHGWAGVMWLSYFHWSILIGFSLFLVWGNFFINLGWKRRILINALAIMYGVFIYYGLGISLTYNFASGLSGFFLAMQTPAWQFDLIRFSILLIVPFIPIGAYLLLKLFKREPRLRFLTLSFIGIIAPIPLSFLILKLVGHHGGQYFVHSIKSGMFISFWTFSIGLLIVGQRTKPRIHNKV